MKFINICAEQLARAMREEYIVDPQGRRVRAKHAARIKQAVLWDDIRTASREHMQIALQQRRQQIVGDCHQLKLDVESYNENRNYDTPIQMVFDFTIDLIEMEMEKKPELAQSPTNPFFANENLLPFSLSLYAVQALVLQP